jgi:tetratricopeptide (TPR) repeat protein
MTLKSTFCCLGILLFTCSVLPCINESGEEAIGDYSLFLGWTDLYAALKRDLKNDGLKMEENLRSTTSFNDRNRYAVALMFLGRSSEAVELLNKLETEEPGHFFIAANLGTAYELAGRNAEALKWINEGIRRNPNDHKGTEWLHAKILEAKIAQDKDPNYFEKHSVLELQHGSRGELISVGGKTFHPKSWSMLSSIS